MNKELLVSQQQWIREELNRCADFWLTHGLSLIHISEPTSPY